MPKFPTCLDHSLPCILVVLVIMSGTDAYAQQPARAIPVIEKFRQQSRGMGILQGETNTIGKSQLYRNLLDAVDGYRSDLEDRNGELADYLDDVSHILEESERNWTFRRLQVYQSLSLQLTTLKQAHERNLTNSNTQLNELHRIHDDLIERVERRQAQQLQEDVNVAEFDRYGDRLRAVLDLERQLNGYSGSLTSSFVSQISQSRDGSDPVREVYVVSLATNINKGIYPGELNFSSQLQVNIDGSSLREQVTNLFMSYDYDIAPPGKLGREVFGFVSRYSNSYLNVDQRYEGGIGYTFDFKSGGLLPKGKSNDNDIVTLREDLSNDLSLDGKVRKCSDQLCQVYPDYANLTGQDSAAIDEFLQHAKTTNRKKYRKSRLGFLIGGFVELEQIAVPDSVSVITPEGETRVGGDFSFLPTQRTRIALRLHYRGYLSSNVSFGIKPWLIIPAPFFSGWHVEYQKQDGSKIRLLDNRMKVEADLSADFGSASFSLGVVYNYDEAPAGRLISLGSEEYLYTAPNSHFLTQASFTYRF